MIHRPVSATNKKGVEVVGIRKNINFHVLRLSKVTSPFDKLNLAGASKSKKYITRNKIKPESRLYDLLIVSLSIISEMSGGDEGLRDGDVE